MRASADDQTALDALSARLYAAFGNANGAVPDLDGLRDVFLPGCVIAKAVEPDAQVQDLEAFIAQRRPLLTDGRLTGFTEKETAAQTWACGNIAGRCSVYEKSGMLDGVAFAKRGIKNLQFVRLDGRWWISALAWDDERPGLVIPDRP
jgi:hypothetical protein